MIRSLVAAVAIITSTTALAQAMQGARGGDVRPGLPMQNAAPQQVAGPVHVRFRKPSDVSLAGRTMPEGVQRELALHRYADRR
ncbi:hypothetical protein [Rhizorhabdus dicambivorans]|uniref:Uncharacterized protein n=1 Tax=Rhizorhabdus dicambivorans TaxID=1850238 RepID=A0A2A4FU46_9SPHN|nr:hypothetical protein [Rhizorhabdus dicambivorans]PCE40968.1 hypothetical protein COO09_17365 [Rhizorhabdus dicambivorans]